MGELVTINLRLLARGLNVPVRQVQAVVELLDEGNTVPFITRYRKDQTGGLDEEQVRQVQARLVKMRLLGERKQTILRSIESQGKLTEELAQQIHAASTTKRLEDLYLSYKPKKQTLATTARSRGLEPLAEEILRADPSCADLDARAADYANPDRQVPTAADALLGAGHILAERFSELVELRQRLRDILQRTGKVISGHVSGEKPEVTRKSDASGKGRPAGDTAATGGEVMVLPPSTDLGVESVATELLLEATADTEVAGPEMGEGFTGADFLMQVDAASPQEQTDLPAEQPEVVEPDDPPVSSGEGGGEGEEPSGDPPAPEAAPVAEAPAEVVSEAPPREAPALEVSAPEEAKSDGASPAAVVTPVLAPDASSVHAMRRRKNRSKAEQKKNREQKKKKTDERLRKAFSDYFDYTEELRKIPPHRVLAINRGERAKVLRVKVEADLEAMTQTLEELCIPPGHPHADFLRGCARDALLRLILPSLDREARRELTEKAEQHAVQVFARNLRNLLLQPPVRGRRVLAVDPGFKSGCKLVALDQFGNVLAHELVVLIGKPERKEEARRVVRELVQRYQLTAVVIGNGTGCRDAEEFIAGMLAQDFKDQGISYVIVNEAGASVYSTSRIGREEFPDYDASLRGAISIGRRLQDPLSELVKIEPANLGVGLYQHDVKAKHLETSLDEVVESCVNYVGVELNTASPALLRYVSGLNQLTARRLYEHRMQNGPFRSRQQLHDVAGFGEAAFVQAAGFLKIAGGDNPLDATWIHPESYVVAAKILEKLGATPAELSQREMLSGLAERLVHVDVPAMAQELGVGELTLRDILAQLARPGRDPREDLPAPVFKQGILKLEDLTPGMELTGTVLNVVDFGAFVDIGMHDSGLVHVSQLADRFVRDPHEVISVGDIVHVWVIEVDKQRRRVSLTMIPPGRPRNVGHRPKPEEASGEGRPPRPQQDRRPPRRDRRPQGRGGAAPAAAPPSRPAFKPKPKPVTPITEEMKSGKTPMRSFSDLAQFFQGPPATDDAESPPEKPGKDKKKKS